MQGYVVAFKTLTTQQYLTEDCDQHKYHLYNTIYGQHNTSNQKEVFSTFKISEQLYNTRQYLNKLILKTYSILTRSWFMELESSSGKGT